ncbi:MAG: hypothetical protein VYA84_11460 [Planctomycetota bacterium]|nr:hypothetical protein [Planctomycetota bacterium]
MTSRLRLAALGVCLLASMLLGRDLLGSGPHECDLVSDELTYGDLLGSGLDANHAVGMDTFELSELGVASSQDGLPVASLRGRVGSPPRKGGLFSLRAPRIIRPQGFSIHQGVLQASRNPSENTRRGIVALLPESPMATWKKAHHWHQNSGFIDLNSYWDTRELAVTTINLLANLPGGFQYYQFMNYESSPGQGSHDWTGFYSEINLWHSIWRSNRLLAPFDWALQYADGTGPEDLRHGVLRGGIRWRLDETPGRLGSWLSQHWKLRYALTFFCIETNGTGWQIEHMYRRDFFGELIYISGFCDQNIGDHSGHSTWMHEHQLGIRLVPSLYAVAEYRFNGFYPEGQRSGMGVGLEYVIGF